MATAGSSESMNTSHYGSFWLYIDSLRTSSITGILDHVILSILMRGDYGIIEGLQHGRRVFLDLGFTHAMVVISELNFLNV